MCLLFPASQIEDDAAKAAAAASKADKASGSSRRASPSARGAAAAAAAAAAGALDGAEESKAALSIFLGGAPFYDYEQAREMPAELAPALKLRFCTCLSPWQNITLLVCLPVS